MQQLSLKTNMALNTIKSLIGLIVPLITFPYTTRVLGVEGVGKFAFANSIVAYFIMLADLGIKMYAVGRGPALRGDTKKFQEFANSVFSINIVSTIFSYSLLLIVFLITPQLKEYALLLSILSLQIFLSTAGVEWIFGVYEDFLYITIRTIIFSVISIALLFLFVKNIEDLYAYAVIMVISTGGVNILNFFYSRKYCKLKLTVHMELNRHLKPILLLFATQAAIVIYVSSDTTILGFLCGSFAVGIYAVAAKLYAVIKSIIAAIIASTIPRMSSIYGRNDYEEFCKVGDEAYSIMTTVSIPIIIGTMLLSPEIVFLLAGNEYMDAVYPILFLSVSLFFCVGAYFWGQAVLVPVGKEKILFYATVISALINIALNFVLIPYWTYTAAAITTLISEGFTFFFCRYKSRCYIKLSNEISVMCKSLIGSLGIVASYFIVKLFDLPLVLYLIFMITMSIVTYTLLSVLVKNEVVVSIIKKCICICISRLK